MGATVADFILGIAARIEARGAALKKQEQDALAATKADLATVDALAAGAPAALRAIDAAVDAGKPAPVPA